jgi:hypothetical protein
MAGLNYIKLTVTGVHKDACPCCIGGDVARTLGSEAACVCGLFEKALKKHQKGLPPQHTCLRDLPGRGRLFVYMLQKGVLHVELTVFGFLSFQEKTAITEVLRAVGERVDAIESDYGYTAEELERRWVNDESSVVLPEQGLVTAEQDARLAQLIADGPPWEEGRSERPVPPPLEGHR